MDNTDKLRVLIQHWIDHNKGHVEEFENWRVKMEEEGQEPTAASITAAVEKMAEVNAELGKALHSLGGPLEGHEKHHHSH